MNGKILFGIMAIAASLMLAESLVCNRCPFSLLGFCLSTGEVTCSSNTSVCFTGRARFPSLNSFSGFNNQGCRDSAGCNATTNGTLLMVSYTVTIECCSTDKCNPVQVSSAPSTKMSLSIAMSAAVLASVWGSMS